VPGPGASAAGSVAAMIGFDSAAETRGFIRGLVVGIVIGALATCSPARAQDIGRAILVATSGDGASITLHDGRGLCVGEARAAVWASPDRTSTILGCWVAAQSSPYVLVSFLDGERADIPLARLVRVAGS